MTSQLPGIDALLADCLSALERGEALDAILRRYPQQAGELKPLLEMAVWMGAERSQVAPRPGFVKASRSRLVATIEAEKAAANAGWTARLGLNWRYALQVVMLVLVMGCLIVSSSGIAYAAQASLPGERLYPVKLAIEKVELLAALDPEQEIRLHTRFAQRRLMEMQELVLQGRTEHIGVAAALYHAHIDRSLALLEGLANDNPRLAREMASGLEGVFRTQVGWLGFLQDQAPGSAWGVIEAVRDAAGESAGKAGKIQRETDDPPPQAATSTAGLTPTPEARTGGQALITPTSPNSPMATRTHVPGGSGDPTTTSTPAPTGVTVYMATATPTSNPGSLPDAGRVTPTSPPTIAPTITKPPAPTATATRQPPPTATNTSVPPTATRTSPPPTATNTSPPPLTNTPVPPPTNTPVPPPTNTPVPPPTNTPVPPRPTDTPPPYPGP